MAKEWAHYRYGVFDEGGIPYDIRHPSGFSVYQTDGSIIAQPNTCSNSQNLRVNGTLIFFRLLNITQQFHSRNNETLVDGDLIRFTESRARRYHCDGFDIVT